MASAATTAGDEGPRPAPLRNRPETKLPPLPKGSRIQKRPLPCPSPASSRANAAAAAAAAPSFDPDGYRPPPRASHTSVIKVSSSASFMSLVRRVRKALEKRTQAQASTKGLPLAARVAALKAAASTPGGGGGGSGNPVAVEDALDDVVLVATGKAIARAVEVGGFFTRERDLLVLVRTRTLQAVDDVVAGEEDDDGEDQVRVRNVSCVEIGIRWAS
ncbi:cf82a31a-aadb-4f17-8d4b-fecabb8ff6b2 [Thermothielavioides terrestris]|uniref:Cf82a31a-aadb-4f17-8d4b-fecabb8ff6b2 n=1 Tax=Thermothielavioides terrestris TaxID=2587410 RepID=A0A446BBS3_9PEZI|nr:cf82a31a-aadb-4f17-8d4b-fecabb8ff6b2 [Thermothielavioides terrestris]